MARLAIRKESYRTLFARSGNQCAFPQCTHPLVEEDGLFVAEICHIEAALPGGPRFNPQMTDDERVHPSNLLVLCHRHHKRSDDEKVFPVAALKTMKSDHEQKWSERAFEVPDDAIERIVEDELGFWGALEAAHITWLEEFNLAMPVEFHKDPTHHLDDIEDSLFWLEKLSFDLASRLSGLAAEIKTFLTGLGYDTGHWDDVPYYENPFDQIEWERLNIGAPNASKSIRLGISMLRVGLLFEMAKHRPSDSTVAKALEQAKTELRRFATETIAHD